MKEEVQRFGQMFLKIEDNLPVYGFCYNYRDIERFVKLTDGQIRQVTLPNFGPSAIFGGQVESEYIQTASRWIKGKTDEKEIAKIRAQTGYDKFMPSYLEGSSHLLANSFKGIKELEVHAPIDYSLRICDGAFDDNAIIKFVLPQNMDLFVVNTNFGRNWTLIAHKCLEDAPIVHSGGDVYWASKYGKRDAGNFIVEHKENL